MTTPDVLPPDTRVRPPGLVRLLAGQATGRGLHLLANIVSTLAIIRYLAPGRYGQYVVVLTTVMLAGLVADGGLTKLAIREVTQGTVSEAAAAGSVAALRVGLALASAAASQVLLLCLGASSQMYVAAGILSLTYATEAIVSLTTVVLHVRLRQDLETGIRLLGELIETAVLLLMIRAGTTFVLLFAAPLIGGCVAAATALMVGVRRYRMRLSFDRAVTIRFFREAIPLLPALLVGVIALRLDGLLLAVLRTPREVGLYGSAFQPIEYAFLATGVVIGTAFPSLAASYRTNRPKFDAVHRSTMSMLLSLTLLVPTMALCAGTSAVRSLFGDGYADAAPLLKLLALSLPFMALNAWNAFALLAGGHQRVTLRYDLMGLAAAAVVHPVLIAWRGTSGAALGTLCVMSVVLVCSNRALRAHMDVTGAWTVWVRPIGAASVAVTIGLLVGRTGLVWWLIAGVVAVVHLAVAAGTGGLPLMPWSQTLAVAQPSRVSAAGMAK